MGNHPSASDLSLFVAANTVNLLVSAVFVCRRHSYSTAEYYLGLVTVLLAVPITVAVVSNVLNQRQWWAIVLPIPLVAFLVIEFLFDYYFKIEFRSSPLIWPYIGFYYLGLTLMIGYSFLMGRSFGFITLVTYFVNVGAAWYGHGR